jgi:hypothetical protein
MEHYCTLFDRFYLPQGMALHASLERSAAPFTLWILCMDQQTRNALETLALPHTRLLSLGDCETPDLRVARSNRSHGEYCWTLASHLFSFVLDRAHEVGRLTYLDADVFFFGSPAPFFTELEAAGKPVLITEHAHAPAWAHYSLAAGRYCVQFVTFTRTAPALRLLERWQGQTRESCTSERGAPGFGDQKYLDEWPSLFPEVVHVLDHRHRTLAPWNADHAALAGTPDDVVFYHFHTFRLLGRRWTQWMVGYPLGQRQTRGLYQAYDAEVTRAVARLAKAGLKPELRPFRPGFGGWLRVLRSFLRGELHWKRHNPLMGT